MFISSHWLFSIIIRTVIFTKVPEGFWLVNKGLAFWWTKRTLRQSTSLHDTNPNICTMAFAWKASGLTWVWCLIIAASATNHTSVTIATSPSQPALSDGPLRNNHDWQPKGEERWTYDLRNGMSVLGDHDCVFTTTLATKANNVMSIERKARRQQELGDRERKCNGRGCWTWATIIVRRELEDWVDCRFRAGRCTLSRDADIVRCWATSSPIHWRNPQCQPTYFHLVNIAIVPQKYQINVSKDVARHG